MSISGRKLDSLVQSVIDLENHLAGATHDNIGDIIEFFNNDDLFRYSFGIRVFCEK